MKREWDWESIRGASFIAALGALFVGVLVKGGYDQMKRDEEAERDKTRVRWTDEARWDR